MDGENTSSREETITPERERAISEGMNSLLRARGRPTPVEVVRSEPMSGADAMNAVIRSRGTVRIEQIEEANDDGND